MAKSIYMYYLAKSQWSSQINLPKKLDPFFLILPCLFVSFPQQHSVCFIKPVHVRLDYYIFSLSGKSIEELVLAPPRNLLDLFLVHI